MGCKGGPYLRTRGWGLFGRGLLDIDSMDCSIVVGLLGFSPFFLDYYHCCFYLLYCGNGMLNLVFEFYKT